MAKISINELMKECHEKGLTEDQTVAEFITRFPSSVIKNMGGVKRVRAMYRSQTVDNRSIIGRLSVDEQQPS